MRPRAKYILAEGKTKAMARRSKKPTLDRDRRKVRAMANRLFDMAMEDARKSVR